MVAFPRFLSRVCLTRFLFKTSPVLLLMKFPLIGLWALNFPVGLRWLVLETDELTVCTHNKSKQNKTNLYILTCIKSQPVFVMRY